MIFIQHILILYYIHILYINILHNTYIAGFTQNVQLPATRRKYGLDSAVVGENLGPKKPGGAVVFFWRISNWDF